VNRLAKEAQDLIRLFQPDRFSQSGEVDVAVVRGRESIDGSCDSAWCILGADTEEWVLGGRRFGRTGLHDESDQSRFSTAKWPLSQCCDGCGGCAGSDLEA